MFSSLTLALTAILMTSQWSPVLSHGRLWTPPGRATMWRKGFKTPSNVNDNQMFCGGLDHQKKQGYKCGLCGDPYDSDRPHEAGGKYATGTIAATYKQGQEVELVVDLTANHKGWFEFKICPTNDYKKKASQECLDLYPLQLSDGSGTKLDVSSLGDAKVSIPVKLPKDLTCDLCMLQWHYHCGNNWGSYTNQEEFYGCADIKIEPNSHSDKYKPTPPSITKVTRGIFKPLTKMATRPSVTSQRPTTGRKQEAKIKPQISDKVDPKGIRRCKAAKNVPGMDKWCYVNCHNGKSCPASHCKCEVVSSLP